jgi:hypothetical protein
MKAWVVVIASRKSLIHACVRDNKQVWKGKKKTGNSMANIEDYNSPDGIQKFPNFVIFKTADGKVNIDVFFKDETLWLTQKALSVLFEKDRTVIGRHLKSIFESGELSEQVVCANFALTTQHGAIEGKTQELFRSISTHF